MPDATLETRLAAARRQLADLEAMATAAQNAGDPARAAAHHQAAGFVRRDLEELERRLATAAGR